jgi:hypothetical protein
MERFSLTTDVTCNSSTMICGKHFASSLDRCHISRVRPKRSALAGPLQLQMPAQNLACAWTSQGKLLRVQAHMSIFGWSQSAGLGKKAMPYLIPLPILLVTIDLKLLPSYVKGGASRWVIVSLFAAFATLLIFYTSPLTSIYPGHSRSLTSC